MNTATLASLRLVHIVTGALWVGSAWFLAAFLVPAVRAVGAGAGPVMDQVGRVQRLPLFMMAVSLLSLLSGFFLYWHDSNGFHTHTWLRSTQGITFGLGGALAVLAAAVGMAVNSPAGRRMTALAAQMRASSTPPAANDLAEVRRLQARLAVSGTVVALLLLFATAAMAVARYLP